MNKHDSITPEALKILEAFHNDAAALVDEFKLIRTEHHHNAAAAAEFFREAAKRWRGGEGYEGDPRPWNNLALTYSDKAQNLKAISDAKAVEITSKWQGERS